MILKEISVEAWGPFVHQELIPFPVHPGVYEITGVNNVQPEISPNGTGKSATLEAWCWCWFGKTSKGLKAKKIENWADVHHTSVKTHTIIRKQSVIVARHQSPNSLTLSIDGSTPRVVDQAEIERTVGMDYNQFLCTVMFAQFGTHFMDMAASAQAGMLSRVLKLDGWTDAATKARKSAAQEAKEVADLDRTLSEARAAFKANEQTKERLQIAADEWAAEQAIAMKDRARALKQAKDDYAKAKLEAQAAVVKHRDAVLEAEKARTAIDGWEIDIEGLASNADATAARVVKLEAKVARAQERVASSKRGKCSACGQAVPERKAELKAAAADLAVAIRRLESVQEAAQDAALALEVAEAARDAGQKTLVEVEKRVQREEWEAAKLDEAARQLKRTVDDLESAKQAENPFTSQIEAIEVENKRIRSEADGTIKVRRKKAVRRHKRLEFWAKEFPKIRLWIMDQASAELASYATDALALLGMGGWRVECRTKRALASGEDVAEFGCDVYAPGSPNGVAFAQWSGGESQLVRIAVASAFAELAGARMPYRPQFELWDEPTAHLSEAACEKLIGFLAHRSQVLKKQILLIDHRLRYSGLIKDRMILAKESTGTRVLSHFSSV